MKMIRVFKLNSLILKPSNVLDRPFLSQFKLLHDRRCISSSTVLCCKTEETSKQIYAGPLTPQIRAVKIFSLTSSVAGVVAQPILISEAASIGSTGLLVAMCSVVGFFTFVTPVLLHFITKKYVTELEYDPTTATFTATTITFLLTRKRVQFKADDVVVPELPGMFTTLEAKGHPLFLEARHFSEPVLYAKLMGYDKPMDFKLGKDQLDDKHE